MTQQKTEFKNVSGGIIGVVTIEPGGKIVPLPVQPDATIWLSEEEEIATANAPQRSEDNPFINGQLQKVTDAADIKNRRPIGSSTQESPEAAKQRQEALEAKAQLDAENEQQRVEEAARLEQGQKQAQQGGQPPPPPRQAPDETAAPPQPQGKAAEGSRAAGEEVGTPEAVGKA